MNIYNRILSILFTLFIIDIIYKATIYSPIEVKDLQKYIINPIHNNNKTIDNIWGNYNPSYFTNFTRLNKNISYETSKILVHIKIVPKIYNYYNVKEEHFTKKNLK
jgi:hypothetical protein